MSRLRVIKPDFWASEQVMDMSPLPRLAFIGLWNFADDRGVHPASPKTLKAELFPSDDITADQVAEMVAEMICVGLVGEFEQDGKRYWFVTGWARHQRIDRPTYRHPAPPDSAVDQHKDADSSTSNQRGIDEQSATPRDVYGTRNTETEHGKKHCAIPSHDAPLKNRFSEFWETYPSGPRKVAKASCLKKWQAKKLDAIADTILADLEAKKLTAQFLEFTPGPLTYLSQERWLDGNEGAPEKPAVRDWI